jgi:hypothetical protein
MGEIIIRNSGDYYLGFREKKGSHRFASLNCLLKLLDLPRYEEL